MYICTEPSDPRSRLTRFADGMLCFAYIHKLMIAHQIFSNDTFCFLLYERGQTSFPAKTTLWYVNSNSNLYFWLSFIDIFTLPVSAYSYGWVTLIRPLLKIQFILYFTWGISHLIGIKTQMSHELTHFSHTSSMRRGISDAYVAFF